jgi:MYXO-CTERM domain-containing protein
MLFHRAGARAALLAATSGAALLVAPAAHAATPFVWKGHTWNVTSGGMAGVADGSPTNVSIDGSGYLHLKITNTDGTWTASELFTTDDLGFGTYQWQVDGPIDVYDKNVVLGLFPYGPAGGIGKDGTNEIDIEFSRWGQANGPNADWTDYPSSGTTQGEMSFSFSLGGGTLSTSRFVWTSTSIEDFLMTGIQPIGSTTGLVKSWTYAPANAMVNIPQQAMPLGINLWCFAIPSDAKDEEVVIRDFEFVPEGTPIPDAGAGAGGDASASADAGAGAGGGADSGANGDSDAGVGASADSDAGVSSGAGVNSEAGAGAGSGAGADSGSVPSSPGDTSTPSSSGCSCTVARTDAPAGGALLFLSAALVAVRRRRSRERAGRAVPSPSAFLP